jgi:hypothetical protein
MSRKTVTRTAPKSTAKAQPATHTAEQVGEILGRLANALLPNSLATRAEAPEAAPTPASSLTLDRMAEHRDFASRVAALAIVIQRDAEQEGTLIPNLARALEDLAHAEYSTVAGNMRVIAELQAGREVHA